MKKILLIQPNYRGGYFSTLSRPVGLGYIAESLRVAGIDYEVVDLNLHNEDFLYRKIEHFQPDLIGISLMTHRYKRHYKLIKEIKSKFPTIKIVAGGPHISYLREQVLKECPEIDFGVTLEGEETIIDLCKGKEIHEIKGVLYRNESDIRYNRDRDFIMNLDNIPFPTYSGFELDKYPKGMNIVSSRGCPYNCIFCGAWMAIGKKWRARSPLNVINEIEYWYERGFRQFDFVDSNFSMDKKRVYDFCDELEKRNFKITLNCAGIRADRVDFEVLKRMKEVGFRSLYLGVECGNNKILRNLKKGETIEEIEGIIKDACELGYGVTLSFLIGSPGETKEDVEDSFRLACKYPVANVWFFHLIPIPQTELFDWVTRNNYLVQFPERYLSGNFGIENSPIFFTPTLSINDRKKLHRRGMRLQKEIIKKNRFRILFDFLKPKLGSLAYIGAFIASRSLTSLAWKYVPLKIKNFLKALITEKDAGGND